VIHKTSADILFVKGGGFLQRGWKEKESFSSGDQGRAFRKGPIPFYRGEEQTARETVSFSRGGEKSAGTSLTLSRGGT